MRISDPDEPKGKTNMMRRTLPVLEYQYVYNSGVESRALFNTQEDFDRFEAYLYMLNAEFPERASNFFASGRPSPFTASRGEQVVSIAAYSIMPKAFHIVMASAVEGGIAKFMQRLQTAYTMYFNYKHVRKGRLLQSSYRHVNAHTSEDVQLFLALSSLVPASLFDEDWYVRDGVQLDRLARRALEYRYVSPGSPRSTAIMSDRLPKELVQLIGRLQRPQSLIRTWEKQRTRIGNLPLWIESPRDLGAGPFVKARVHLRASRGKLRRIGFV